ncbi:hypothetical protein AOC05_04950 [Arthrobacter alpinus]|uniref:DUF3168 domain-containing protein n=1 Tax=Arthrobacter alpinus TaxID=656366 RepID=A0A0M4RMU4_9MICC|nr:hypothetical protein AOC05_04950 [Arthrobacter alpinus]
MSVRAHYESLYALLKAELPITYTVYAFDVPAKPTYPYVLVWGDLGQETGESLCGTPDLLNLRPRVTYAGVTGYSILSVADKVRAVLFDRALSVAGWSPTRLRQASLAPIQSDFDVTIPNTSSHPSFCVDEFPFTSQRA